METIRNYLESMFAAMPDSDEVRRAKQVLGEMMEDKYSELLAEGKSENEAIGVVIAEFGNLGEVADELGLAEIVRDQPADEREVLSLERAEAFIRAQAQAALLIGLGVFLCIISPVGCIFAGYAESGISLAVGTSILFGCVAVAVGLFVYAGFLGKGHSAIARGACRTEYGTAVAINGQWESQRPTYALMTVIGVVLCIASVIPVCVMGALAADDGFLVYVGSILLFLIVGLGVMLLVVAGVRKEAYQKILNLNRQGTIGGRFAEQSEDADVRYESRAVAAIMSVYWPTITCIYLILSFLSFAWGRTWIIWPIAALIHTVLKRLLGTKTESGVE